MIDSGFNQIKKFIAPIAITVSLAIGAVACNSYDEEPSSYDPNADPAPAVAVDL